ncbi:MAG: hypothetical protein FD169_70 [Bacillota bacterium]|nr:MAG: hypothetical protein FD169_70 [Bacillota bacterium]
MPTILKAQLFSGFPLRHGFSTREGGVSQGDLKGLNLSYSCGDIPQRVSLNRYEYFARLGSDPTAGVFCQQVHGNRVIGVTNLQGGSGMASFESGIPNCDGLITAVPELSLNIFTADCVAILFYDPKHHVAAACHAGWLGSAAGIVDNALRGMSEMWDSQAPEVLVAMGPSASGCCYEVDEKVVKALDDGLERDYRYEAASGKFMVDLRIYNTLRLTRLGVKPTSIERVGGCSICGCEYYSHRRQVGKAGRMLATIELLYVN